MKTVHEYCESIRQTLAEIDEFWPGEPDQRLRDELNIMYLHVDRILTSAKWGKQVAAKVDAMEAEQTAGRKA